jgi:hypothetical protein
MKHLGASALAVLLICGEGAALAADDERTRANARAPIESCAGGDRIVFASADQSALLDEMDRGLVSAAMLERYPVLQRDGFAPSQIILWQKLGGELLYVTLITNPAKPNETCFTATLSADRFEITQLLRHKYLLAGSRI